MRVVQINYAFDPGLADGAALLARYATLTGWSDALVAAGVDVVQVVQRFHRDEDRACRGVDYFFRVDGPTGRPHLWWVGARIAQAVTALDPDVVHVNGLGFGLPTWMLRRQLLRTTTACVVQDHGGGGPHPVRTPLGRLKQRVCRHCLSTVDAFFFSTISQADPWRSARLIAPRQSVYGVMEASTTLRPIDRVAAERATGIAGAPSILWVGRLNANKDPLTVLAAFERSLDVLPGAQLFMIYGGGDLVRVVTERIRASERLVRSVRLIGSVPHADMPAFYSAADLFVLGSHHEGSGYALLEAMACGCVPVVTDIASFRVITDGGSLGASWTPGSVSRCAAALVQAAKGDLARTREKVRAHFERELSWSAVGHRAKAAYEDVVARRRLRTQTARPPL